jgi:hypothetical protein
MESGPRCACRRRAALDPEAAVERLDAIGQAAQARTAGGVGAPDAVVGCTRGGQLVVGIGIRERLRDQLGEVGETLLGAERKGVSSSDDATSAPQRPPAGETGAATLER